MGQGHITVGMPLNVPGRAGGGLKWRNALKGAAAPLRLGAGPRRVAEGAGDAPANIAAQPLPFLSARNFLALVFFAALVILPVGRLAFSNHQSVAESYEISQLTQTKMDLLETNRRLKAELAALGSLTLLEKAARDTLGLVTPGEGQIVVIDQ